jgi:hypothetical protein
MREWRVLVLLRSSPVPNVPGHPSEIRHGLVAYLNSSRPNGLMGILTEEWMVRRSYGSVMAWLLLVASPVVGHASTITVFSTGFTVPESITPVPAGFGSVGGSLIVPDAGASALYVVPAGGGPATLFASGVAGVQGVFLPSTYGSLAGDFLVPQNNDLNGPNNGNLLAVSGSGAQTVIQTGSTKIRLAASRSRRPDSERWRAKR